MEKISNETLKLIFHAYADAEIETSNGCIYKGCIYKYFKSERFAYFISDNTFIWLEDCHIILKRLSAIGENTKHCIDIAIIFGYQAEQIQAMQDGEMEDIPGHLEEVFNGNSALMADYVDGNTFIKLIDYLRSKSYNLGYGEFSPKDLVDLKIVKEIS